MAIAFGDRAQRVAHGVLTGLWIALGLVVLARWAPMIVNQPDAIFPDARLYFRATEAWLQGGDPWRVVGPDGIAFAAPPPSLLLNLPLLPLGVEGARVAWIVAGAASVALVLWRSRVGPWFVLWLPLLEAYLTGTPDVVLLGLASIGAGFVAAATKPYSVPALLAARRYRETVIGAGLVVVTALVLPWGTFIADLGAVRTTLDAQAAHVSAWGDWLLMAVTLAALASLGLRRALFLFVPTLWPTSQLHYSLFSLPLAARSAALAFALAVPGYTPHLVIAYAVADRLIPLLRRRLAVPALGVGRSAQGDAVPGVESLAESTPTTDVSRGDRAAR